jgi:hypothetical protein
MLAVVKVMASLVDAKSHESSWLEVKNRSVRFSLVKSLVLLCDAKCYGGCNFMDFVASKPCAWIGVGRQRRARDKARPTNGARCIIGKELAASQIYAGRSPRDKIQVWGDSKNLTSNPEGRRVGS